MELWCRGDEARRRIAYETLSNHIASALGRSMSQAFVPQILYHGVLVELPAARVRETMAAILDETYMQLLRCEDVMFFRPQAQSAFPGYAIEDKDVPPIEAATAGSPPGGEPSRGAPRWNAA